MFFARRSLSTQELTHGLNTGRVAWEEGHSMWRGETDVEAVLASLIGGAR